ncbi:hypothetical protein [Rhodococcus sp. NPDC059234]|uniref:hypothetical protein n=1 Tax=Rhodococcus sp. NPDC059234 TaxID=3346781 RepID=UPI00366EDB98
MKSSRKSIARVGSVVGFAALALLANPGLSSATVTGYAKASWLPDRTITMELTGVSSPTLVGCHVDVVEFMGRYSHRGEVVLTGGSGTYTSPVLNTDWSYNVNATCVDADGAMVLPSSPDTRQMGSVEEATVYGKSFLSLFGS